MTTEHRYCCELFKSAVEFPGKDALHIKLIDFQGDPTWAVMNLGIVGGNLLIGYCPWCGSCLPKQL